MINRLEELHFCPLLDIRALTASFAIAARLLVWATINASFPPSSRTEGLRYFPARDPIARPAHSDHVRLTHCTSFRERIYSLSADEMRRFW